MRESVCLDERAWKRERERNKESVCVGDRGSASFCVMKQKSYAYRSQGVSSWLLDSSNDQMTDRLTDTLIH